MVALVASEYPLDSFLDTVLCQFMELHNEIWTPPIILVFTLLVSQITNSFSMWD
jgi:hypothetical protein